MVITLPELDIKCHQCLSKRDPNGSTTAHISEEKSLMQPACGLRCIINPEACPGRVWGTSIYLDASLTVVS